MVLVFWAFTGLESAAVAVDVIDNPRRNLPIAALLGVAIAAAVYMACCTVLMGIVPARELAESSAPFALVATRMFGPAVAAAIVLTTMLKAMGTHGGWTLVCAATSKAAADNGSFPRLFARTDRRGIPARGLLVHGALMTGATFATMSPSIGQQFNKLIDVSVVLTLVCYCYSAIALCRMRRWRDSGAKRDWLIAIAAFAFSAWVIVASDLSLLIIAVIIIATSGMFYPFFKGGKNMRAAA
jgi:arginine:agmatine antiporter